MPNLFKFGPYSLYFWSNEGNEPIHVHTSIKRASKNSAKFWLLRSGKAELAYNHAGFSKKELSGIAEFIDANFSDIIKRWKEYFSLNEIKYYE